MLASKPESSTKTARPRTKILLGSLAVLAALGAAACVESEEPTPAPAAPAPPPPPPKPGYAMDTSALYTLTGLQSGKCINPKEAAPHDLEIRTCATATNSRIRFEPKGAGFHRVHFVDADLCLDISTPGTDSVKLVGRACNDSPSQQWSLPQVEPGVVKVDSRLSHMSADVFDFGTADGSQIKQCIGHEMANQRFRIQTAPSKDIAVGFATVDGPLTGGGRAPATVAATLAELTAAVTGPAPRVVRISGAISGAVAVGPNKTIEGAPDAALTGQLNIAGSSNVIVRNLKIVGTSCAGKPGCQKDADAAVTITGGANHVWIDHCDISKGTVADLIVDDTADAVTVSWTKLSQEGAKGKRQGALIGPIGKADTKADKKAKEADKAPAVAVAARPRVTFHHDWWTGLDGGATPRVRSGLVHVFNSYFDSAKSKTAVEATDNAKVVLENNQFKAVKKPQSLQGATAELAARGNNYESPPGAQDAKGEAFHPSYPFKLDDVGTVVATVKAEAGVPSAAPPAAAPTAKR